MTFTRCQNPLKDRKGRKMCEGVGIVKEIDRLGRIVIPKEIRERFCLDDRVELVVTRDGVLIRSLKYTLVRVNEKEKYEDGIVTENDNDTGEE